MNCKHACCLLRASQPLLDGTLPMAVSKPAPYRLARAFSASSQQLYPRKPKKHGDSNKMRGVSAIRGTGLRKRQTLSVKIEDLAVPAALEQLPPLNVRSDHGLWGFFRSSEPLTPPEVMSQHGRAWTYQELSRKNWEDLHALWWTCLRERNWISTEQHELRRLEHKHKKTFYGNVESQERDKEVRRTMAQIRAVLTKRWYAWEDARQIVAQGGDPEVRYNAESGKFEYLPQVVDEEDYIDESKVDDENGIEAELSQDAGFAEEDEDTRKSSTTNRRRFMAVDEVVSEERSDGPRRNNYKVPEESTSRRGSLDVEQLDVAQQSISHSSQAQKRV